MRILVLLILIFGLVRCNVPLEEDEMGGANPPGLAPPSSIFEGEWTWVETNGVDLDGQVFKKDSISEGYSLRFEFYESNGPGGKLQTYKDKSPTSLYIYEYTVSENSLQQKISLDKMNNSLPDVYCWEITFSEEESHLYLRNAAYFTDYCCDEKVELHFLLTGVSPL